MKAIEPGVLRDIKKQGANPGPPAKTLKTCNNNNEKGFTKLAVEEELWCLLYKAINKSNNIKI
jgi:hypothetical protein